MHEFPPTSELRSLIGEKLMQVCLDPYSTQFHFDPSRITAESGIEHVEPDGAVWRYDCVAHEGGPMMLHRLVGRAISSLESQGRRLKICFDNGAELHLLSDVGPYESGQIGTGGQFIVY